MLRDPTGAVRWEGTVEGTQLEELRDFDPVTWRWLLQLDGGRATGSYNKCWQAR